MTYYTIRSVTTRLNNILTIYYWTHNCLCNGLNKKVYNTVDLLPRWVWLTGALTYHLPYRNRLLPLRGIFTLCFDFTVLFDFILL